jgi:nicotinamide-nucleotide amidase
LYAAGMVTEIINTGSELMLGRVLNTHQQWLCRQVADMGGVVSRQVAVPDRGPDIINAVQESLGRADLVITTGGLGPTSDDVTRTLIAQMLGRKLVENDTVVAQIRNYFETRGRRMPPATQVQALVPEGAVVLHNAHGTAPGLVIEIHPNPFGKGKDASACLVMLPGPPRELRPMFSGQVAPMLKAKWPNLRCICHTLRTCGIGESMVEERVGTKLQALVARGLELGYCARTGEVDVRLLARGETAEDLVGEAETIVRGELGCFLYTSEERELEEVVVQILSQRNETLALAESCTGGLIGHRLTNVPGASAVLMAGIVSYSNAAKHKFLGVPERTFQEHGAVSDVCARQMAEGARAATGCTYGLSVTGIAGPSGGTPEKPAGTVFIGFSKSSGTVVEQRFNPFDRQTFKQVTSQQALDLVRRNCFET